MTNEEAIVVLQKIKPIPHRGDSKSTTHILETIALDMAIKALEQQSKTGHWVNLENAKCKGQVLPFWGRYECSKCGGHGEGTFNYCPNCGARMEV